MIHMHKSTILIVDDEPVGRRILEVLLADQGYHLVSASNGPEALAQAAMLTPDLILLDIMMPNMDGFEVCQHLRADPLLAEVPVVMVTALDDRESRLRGIEVGADDFITKPIDRVEVRKRVQTIIRLDRYRRLLMEREQRQQAEEEIRRRNRELTLLNDFITAAASMLDVSSVLHFACKALCEAFEIPSAIALLLDEEQQQATIAAGYAVRQQGASAADANAHPYMSAVSQVLTVDAIPALALMVEQRQPLAICDAQHDMRLEPMHDFLHEYHIASVLLVPILIRDRVAGSIQLCANTRRTFNSHDFALAQSVATAAGQAMETAQLYQQLQRHADHLEETVAQRTQELQTERDRTQAILEALGEAVVVTDHEGQIQYVNPAATELTGFSSAEVVGQNWNVWQGDGQSPELYTQIRHSVQAGKTWRGEVVQKHRSNKTYDTAMTVAPIFDPHVPDVLIGIVSVQRDVTPLKEAERLKDQFVSNVSHELRTPLSIITLLSGNLDTLFERLEPQKRRKMIQDIREHAQVLNDLISSVLEISRIDRRISAEYEPLNLMHLVRDETKRQFPLAQKKSQHVHAYGDEHLGTWGNDGQLRQIVRNVLNNAIKYTPAEGQIICECHSLHTTGESLQAANPPRLLWSLLPEDTTDIWPGADCLPKKRWAAMRVIDTGIGISLEDLPHIFERFYRVQSQSNVPGTGLGLSIAQELVELHGGYLAIASRPDKGSIVAIYLPLVEDTKI
jgi:PAS domain S-box-containing protein